MFPLAELTESLQNRGWFVSADLVPPEIARALLQQLQIEQKAGSFREAAIGQGPRQQRVSEVRGDHIKWLDDKAPTVLEKPFLEWLEGFKAQLNQHLYLGVTSHEMHYAAYPPGAGYQKHIDVFQRDSARVLSFVLYLNDAWKAGDGGELAIFSEQNPDHLEIKISPVFPLCAVFLSDKIYHQVEFTNRVRFSVTGWLKKSVAAPV